MAAESLAVAVDEDGSVEAFADGEVDRSGDPRCEWHRDELATLACHRQGSAIVGSAESSPIHPFGIPRQRAAAPLSGTQEVPVGPGGIEPPTDGLRVRHRPSHCLRARDATANATVSAALRDQAPMDTFNNLPGHFN
jgi:hypothetical protein